ncbi:MAG: hypothetical protein KAQ64_01330 [Candidatus Pacebacteria bacterium]|nr:hypothetical protein [Candidatus Paceibacterota bacterium]
MKKSVKITKDGKNIIFENCTIYGGVENAGKNNKFKSTIIGLEQKIKANPIKTIIIGVIIIVLGLAIEYYFFQ